MGSLRNRKLRNIKLLSGLLTRFPTTVPSVSRFAERYVPLFCIVHLPPLDLLVFYIIVLLLVQREDL